MEYAFSFFAKRKPRRARPPGPLGALGAGALGGGRTPPAARAPTRRPWPSWRSGPPACSMSSCRCSATARCRTPLALGGARLGARGRMTVPLPEHTRVTQLLRSQGARVYVEAAGAPRAHQNGACGGPAALLRCGCPPPCTWASPPAWRRYLHRAGLPAARLSSPRSRVRARVPRGGVLTVRGAHYPAAQFKKRAGARACWCSRGPRWCPSGSAACARQSPPCRGCDLSSILTNFVQTRGAEAPFPSATASSDNFAQTLALLRSLHRTWRRWWRARRSWRCGASPGTRSGWTRRRCHPRTNGPVPAHCAPLDVDRARDAP